MILPVNPTRMELLRLKKRIVLARRGHKLLKDKQDELMKIFLDLIYQSKAHREKTEEKLKNFYEKLTKVYSLTFDSFFLQFVAFSRCKIEITESSKPIMNLKLPEFKMTKKNDWFAYSLTESPVILDELFLSLEEILKDLIKLSELENSIQILSEEIEKTRRRVNALEYILIPNLVDTIKYISMKITEVERDELNRIMKIKEIVRAH